jgi:hypothetical protein
VELEVEVLVECPSRKVDTGSNIKVNVEDERRVPRGTSIRHTYEGKVMGEVEVEVGIGMAAGASHHSTNRNLACAKF